MREIRKSSQFKKVFKRIKNNIGLITALMRIIVLLEQEETIPAEYNPHMLKGKFKGIMECHIGPDFLLMWIDEKSNTVRLLRLGSHT